MAEVCVIFDTIKFFGRAQVGAGAQVTLLVHPVALMVAPLLNLKVKQPLGAVDVNGPGIVVPQYAPANAPGTVPAGLPLGISGAVVVLSPS